MTSYGVTSNRHFPTVYNSYACQCLMALVCNGLYILEQLSLIMVDSLHVRVGRHLAIKRFSKNIRFSCKTCTISKHVQLLMTTLLYDQLP